MKYLLTPLKARLALTGLLLSSFILLAAPAGKQTQKISDSLSVSGDIPAAATFKASDLDVLPQETATVDEEDGISAKYSGVLLRTLLEKAGAPMGRTLRGKSMASYVVAKARDGYEVVFTLAELDASFGNERVLLAYRRDGKPLFEYQGPFRIVCPSDKAGARSVRMLDSLEVVRLRK